MATTPFARFAPMLFLAVLPPSDSALAPHACHSAIARPLARTGDHVVGRAHALRESRTTISEWTARVASPAPRRVSVEPEPRVDRTPFAPWSRIEALARAGAVEKPAHP